MSREERGKEGGGLIVRLWELCCLWSCVAHIPPNSSRGISTLCSLVPMSHHLPTSPSHTLRPDHQVGDFSFARSLVEHHNCTHVTATCYDSEQVLHEKYPQARENLERLLSYNQASRLDDHAEDEGDLSDEPKSEATAEEQPSTTTSRSSPEWEGLSPTRTSSPTINGTTFTSTANPPKASRPNRSTRSSLNTRISFHACISAKTLSSHKLIRHHGPFNRIIFNFPHVGGLSTDVNRQVRANQELLVGFFCACRPLLASRSRPARAVGGGGRDRERDASGGEEHEDEDEDEGEEEEKARTTGQVIISLFDGEPYSLWNIRDLARHSGFRLVTSWRFPWEAYPGYRHARTMGEVRRKGAFDAHANADVTTGTEPMSKPKSIGPWRGQDRPARGFVFEMVGAAVRPGEHDSPLGEGKANGDGATQKEQKRKGQEMKKRRRAGGSSDDD